MTTYQEKAVHLNKCILSILLSCYFLFLMFPITEHAMAYEEPEYQVIEKEDRFEVREYYSYIAAETLVEGSFKEAGNEGFRRLFKYISGENRSNQSISMTAPVNLQSDAEQIKMTAPVGQGRSGKMWRVTFFMPSQYTMEALPEPLDSRVRLNEVPGRLHAAMRYSGTWSHSRYEKKKDELVEWVRSRGLVQTGEPILARYNSPFTLWFLRRNEVLLPVERRNK